MKRGGFPPLRGTAAWYQAQDERRIRRIAVALLIVATLAALAFGGCNGSHGRC